MADLIDREKTKAAFEPWLNVKGYSEGELNIIRAVLYEITIMPSAQPDVPDTTFGNMISRQAAIDVLEERLQANGYSNVALVSELNRSIGYLMRLPSADAVEVVRCNDCKHYQFADNRAFGFPVKRCEWTGFEDMDNDDFCSRGERKDV